MTFKRPNSVVGRFRRSTRPGPLAFSRSLSWALASAGRGALTPSASRRSALLSPPLSHSQPSLCSPLLSHSQPPLSSPLSSPQPCSQPLLSGAHSSPAAPTAAQPAAAALLSQQTKADRPRPSTNCGTAPTADHIGEY
jgi:hypothetical protein